MNEKSPCTESLSTIVTNHEQFDVKAAIKLVAQLEYYKKSTVEIEKQIGELELEVHYLTEMSDQAKPSYCRSAAGQNICFAQPKPGPPVPPGTKACGVCPPCPAPCNPDAPPTPAEREVARLTIQLKQCEGLFKAKVTECAILRADLLATKEELEKERCQHREVLNKLRELEMKFEGLATQTNNMFGSKEQAYEHEVSVRTLKQCYKEAREEIEELRLLMKEQNEQLQDYRVKYLQAQQLVEEQKKQLDMMDMDNTRISEQINLEIQQVKLKFQEKLQELSPLPDLLRATQLKLKDAQQSQAVAEHNAEQLARELLICREKIHVLLHEKRASSASATSDSKAVDRGDEKLIASLNQRITQLTEVNQAMKNEIERLKNNVIRMEEACLASDKRLQEKLHECAALGGELDRCRDDAARAMARANERTDTMKKCLQTTVAELERQLAYARAQVSTAHKEREELQARMQCHIKRLNENFEQAQCRIQRLTTQVNDLRRAPGDDDADELDCTCKNFFSEVPN
ncbi:CAP-Gly domain-containing linker protein 1-like [Plutella xylostella]|uniref:CAP-Gly domain-containing linker protein 1-like n=1 Tax=Plutella xylostella TaxID=51655 RepID=UPI0020322FE4|nr:CAP-Gly domain-containing linker protein 1-like [Plutella xylostella]